MQWGPIFWEAGMRIAALVDTKCWEVIKPDSVVVDLYVLGGVGELEALREKYVGIPFQEFEELIAKMRKTV